MSRLVLPKTILYKPSWKSVKLHCRNSNQAPSDCLAYVLDAALWCTSHPQRWKHDISLTFMHLLATHTNPVGTNNHEKLNLLTQSPAEH